MNAERIKNLEQWIREDPGDPFNKYALAMELAKASPIKADALFDELLTQHGSYLPTYYTAASFYSSQGEPDRAIGILQLGIDLAKKEKDPKTLRELQSALDELRY
jgi:tetratricopeptide (TPR) repeat protein